MVEWRTSSAVDSLLSLIQRGFFNCAGGVQTLYFNTFTIADLNKAAGLTLLSMLARLFRRDLGKAARPMIRMHCACKGIKRCANSIKATLFAKTTTFYAGMRFKPPPIVSEFLFSNYPTGAF